MINSVRAFSTRLVAISSMSMCCMGHPPFVLGGVSASALVQGASAYPENPARPGCPADGSSSAVFANQGLNSNNEYIGHHVLLCKRLFVEKCGAGVFPPRSLRQTGC